MTSINYNPYVPCIKLRLGTHYIEYSRENLVSLSLTRQQGQPLNIKMSLYDDSAIILESYLLKYKDDISFQYGYEGGIMSPVYKCTLQSYAPEFSAGGVLIDVTLTPPTAEQSGVKTKTYSGKISDIVKTIAKEEGWDVGKIETTKTSGSYTRKNKTAVAFIKQDLIPKAVSTSGKSGYLFQMDSNSKKPRISFTTADISFTPPKTYEVTIGKDSESVISFTPSYTVYPTEYVTKVVDPETNEIFSMSVTGKNSTFSKVTRPIASSSYKVGDLVNIAKNMYATNSALYKKATLVLRGDPTVESMNTISVVVLSKDGLPHSTSGNYLIMSVEDTIEEGNFTTTLELATAAEEPTVQTDQEEELEVTPDTYKSIDKSVPKTGKTTANLNLRSAPNTYGTIYLTIPSGSTVEIVSGPNSSGWYQVRYNNRTGWASGDYINVSTATVTVNYATTSANLNMRSMPNTYGTIYATIPKGTTVTLVNTKDSNGWYQVSYNGKKGWCSGDYLVLTTGSSPSGSGSKGGSNPIGKVIKNSVGDWVCPTQGTITAGYPYYPGGGSHNGLDISDPTNKPPVYAARAGTVIKVNYYEKRHTSFVSGLGINAFGTCVYIDHGGGLVSIYGHMQAGSVTVKVGQTVSAGTKLGRQGNTGIAMGATGIHLHFEVRQNDKAFNPCTNYKVGDRL